MPRTIGIDFGTNNTTAAVLKFDQPVIIPNPEGELLAPSVVAFNPTTNRFLTGTAADRQAMTNAQNTVYSIKRLLGRKFYDPIVQNDFHFNSYYAQLAKSGSIQFTFGNETFTPIELAAMLFRKAKEDAETFLGETVEKAVITVPACFYSPQRQALYDAAGLAGLEVVRMVNEPSAAILSYATRKRQKGIFAVCHMGGSAFGVSIVRVSEGGFEVLATTGESALGGDDFDQRIVTWILEQYEFAENFSLRNDKDSLQRLKWAAEKAKRELSMVQQTEIILPYLPAGEGKFKDLSLTLNREKLLELTRELVADVQRMCERVLIHAKLKAEQVDTVITSGQQTRMPVIQETVTRAFGAVPRHDADPAQEAAQGAAILAGMLQGEVNQAMMLVDVTPFDVSLEGHDSTAAPVIHKNSRVPARETRMFTTTHDDQTGMDFKVYQGNQQSVRDNILLGTAGIIIPPAPRGMPQLEVAFQIDENGILSIDMTNKANGNKERLVLVPPGEAFSTGRTPEAIRQTEVENKVKALEKRWRLLREHLPAEVEGIVNNEITTVKDCLQQNKALDPGDQDVKRLVAVHDCIGMLAGPSTRLKGLEHFILLMSEEEDNKTRASYIKTIELIDKERGLELLTEALQKEEDPEKGKRIREAMHIIGGTGRFESLGI
ncbi:MAG TPA: Hsp70 family protein [Longilinea sp.]|nr:Hsp70 family protein [Longilinea sp.]